MVGLATYKSQRIYNAPNEELVLMLFETAIHRLQNAKEAMEVQPRGDRIRWLEQLGLVRSIYVELANALDHDAAPELTRNLASTYGWVIRRLGEVGKTGDAEGVEGLIRVSDTLLGAFRTAVLQVSEEVTPQ